VETDRPHSPPDGSTRRRPTDCHSSGHSFCRQPSVSVRGSRTAGRAAIVNADARAGTPIVETELGEAAQLPSHVAPLGSVPISIRSSSPSRLKGVALLEAAILDPACRHLGAKPRRPTAKGDAATDQAKTAQLEPFKAPARKP
jgi:hypothetical protein